MSQSAIHAVRAEVRRLKQPDGISDNVEEDEDEVNVLFVSAHHANEIVTPVTAINAIEELIARYGAKPTVRSAVNNNEIWIAPNWNPDGYDIDRAGRGYGRLNGNGVNLNRNYPQG